MSVTNNIKNIRKEKHIQQDELAAAINCNSKTISRYETGKRCPSLEIALRLSKYLNMSTDEIFSVGPDDLSVGENSGLT